MGLHDNAKNFSRQESRKNSLTKLQPPASSSYVPLQTDRFLTTIEDLVAAGIIDETHAKSITSSAMRYRILVSAYYASLIEKGNPLCPIFLQAIPSTEETSSHAPLESPDPLGDKKYMVAPRLTHRLPSRALLHTTTACSTYCRFCFRKSLLNEKTSPIFSGTWDAAFSHLARAPWIDELILSGGDPLMLSDEQLERMVRKTMKIPHIRTLRFHTRVPVTWPARITQSMIRRVDANDRRIIVVTHFNHPREITDQAVSACRLLQQSGIEVWNQCVLLHRVNDCEHILSRLFSTLASLGIRPYYLHHPDRAVGTSHFWVSMEKGREIFRALKKLLSVSALPRYVVDCSDTRGKIDMELLSELSYNFPQNQSPRNPLETLSNCSLTR
jgi:lysine 2,3-aminomutase